jgi:hypothetical protein
MVKGDGAVVLDLQLTKVDFIWRYDVEVGAGTQRQ